ncbi:class I SAM-dependent methyltransferase [Halomonas campisalis]|uniref:Class I SAM-dependent methyltransferase n=1 Tax=Billgrantia campisalis TaxID=74661 RepID=A0ABS9P6W4_9GAMM|nr:class I SAM-dependent methyltransferase [Halomonas campisalis]MCG6657529.1 class I SAM-dependent methyltransferase [Halomonas campisalis]MDR5863124.1 class I SAM-dependent methyltransferase [Halomonas campisalis]
MNAPAANSRFSADWLAQREALDARSRSQRLTGLAAEWLAARPAPFGLVDLGSGTGSNPRFLAPRLPGPQRWRLVDHDAALLARARRSRLHDAAGRRVAMEIRCRSLAPFDATLLEGASLITASALFDLVSRPWCEALIDAAARRGQALLVALSVDGDWAFLDAQGQRCDDDADAEVRTLFQAHQHRDKGLGAALGGEAPALLAELMVAAGYRVASAATPWHLAAGGETACTLGLTLVEGWAAAALEQAPSQRAWLTSWRQRRCAELAAGECGISVGHRDLFAWPGRDGVGGRA